MAPVVMSAAMYAATHALPPFRSLPPPPARSNCMHTCVLAGCEAALFNMHAHPLSSEDIHVRMSAGVY